MRKSTVFIILTLVCVTVGHAQIRSFGIKSGLTLANQDFSYSNDVDLNSTGRVGLDVGIFAEWFDHKSFSLLTEAHFIQKGMVVKQIATGPDGPQPIGILRHSNRLDYLSVPILLKVTRKQNVFSPYVIAGPRFDILLGYESPLFAGIYSQFDNINVGMDVGIGTEMKLAGRMDTLFEVRYGRDFRNSFINGFVGVKNKTYQLLFGLRF